MATRLVTGILREVWQETVPLGGGTAQVVDTGIRISAGQLARVHGVFTVRTPVGSPVFAVATSVNNGRLRLTISNTAAPGNSGTWLLDVELNHSIQQVNTAEAGVIVVVQAFTATVGPASVVIHLSDDEGKSYLAPPLGDFVPEAILYEWVIDLNKISIGLSVAAQINAIIQSLPGGGNCHFNVYIGALTPEDTTGGTIRAVIATTLAAESLASNTGLAFVNPGGLCLVQVTGVVPDRNTTAAIRGISINIG